MCKREREDAMMMKREESIGLCTLYYGIYMYGARENWIFLFSSSDITSSGETF